MCWVFGKSFMPDLREGKRRRLKLTWQFQKNQVIGHDLSGQQLWDRDNQISRSNYSTNCKELRDPERNCPFKAVLFQNAINPAPSPSGDAQQGMVCSSIVFEVHAALRQGVSFAHQTDLPVGQQGLRRDIVQNGSIVENTKPERDFPLAHLGNALLGKVF